MATDAGTPADLAATTAALLDARTTCGDDPACLASVVVDPTTRFSGAVALPASGRTVTLLDEFGDVAVLRVDANDEAQPPQLVVILRRDEKWLLRDVSDVTQQP